MQGRVMHKKHKRGQRRFWKVLLSCAYFQLLQVVVVIISATSGLCQMSEACYCDVGVMHLMIVVEVALHTSC